MDFVNKLTGGNKAEGQQATTQGQQEGSSSGGGFMDKLNGMAGGGKESEKTEDGLDKGWSSYPSFSTQQLVCKVSYDVC